MTTIGFFSIVAHRNISSAVLVRARAREHLEALDKELPAKPPREIEDTPDADYPYRMIVARRDMAEWLSEHVHAIDYDNFKNAAHARAVHKKLDIGELGAAYVRSLHEVWSVMRNITIRKVKVARKRI